MRFFEVNNDREHARELARTGFWGKAGAGCIVLAQSTGRLLLPFRSEAVEQPHTWGTWGGAIDAGESPELAVVREVKEEAGYDDPIIKVIPLFVFAHSSGFRYFNFLVVVEHEFSPDLNWETEGFKWVDYGKWPSPMHFGLISLLGDASSRQKIESEVEKALHDNH